MKKILPNATWARAATLLLLASGLWAAVATGSASEMKKETKMIETYDLRVKNPYGAKLSALPLDTGASFKTISLAIPAGKELPEHKTPSPAVLFLFEGEARFITDQGEIPMTPGTVVHIPADVPHRIVATTDSHLVLVK